MKQNDIKTLLNAYVSDTKNAPIALYGQLEQYLHLLLKWNARTNLTAIRDPEEIVRRHFGESLFAAQHLNAKDLDNCNTLLDFGSGAGFPGLPIQLFHPTLSVTLAESQNKKATFLREAVRTLGLKTEVWPSRVEAMPAERQFDIVALRAVDNMDAAILAASTRAAKRIILLTTTREIPPNLSDFATTAAIPIPGSDAQQLLVLNRLSPLLP